MAHDSEKTISTGPSIPSGEQTAVIIANPASIEKEGIDTADGGQDATFPTGVPISESDTEDPFIGKKLSHYTIRSLIGAGGMGAVYLAEQSVPVRRIVALKVLRAGVGSANNTKRFLAERQALAMMSHTDIAQVYDAGKTKEGHHYFAMELAEGQPIDAFCDERKLGLRERLVLVYRLCDAIEHAHQKGVLHRDIKPGNIIVSDMGNQTRLKVIDFGIAKAFGSQQIADDAAETKVGQIIGTPTYMSPEQAELRHSEVDQRTDVYSIGIVLYKLLTGTTPLRVETLKDKTLTEVLQSIATVHAERPSTRIRKLDAISRTELHAKLSTDATIHSHVLRRDLDWLVLKAVNVDRNARYSSAAELGDDIRRYLDDEPISAVSGSYVYYARTFYRRHRTACLAAAVVLLATLGSAIVYEQTSRRQEAAMIALRGELDSLADEIDQIRKSTPDSPTASLQAWDELETHFDSLRKLANRFAPDDANHARAIALREQMLVDQRALESLLKYQRSTKRRSFFDGGTLSLRSSVGVGSLTEVTTPSPDEMPPVLRPLLVESHSLHLATLPRGVGLGVARDRRGYFVSYVHPDGSSARSGKISVGQRLLHFATPTKETTPCHELSPTQVAGLLNSKQSLPLTLIFKTAGAKSPQAVSLVSDDHHSLELIDSLNRIDEDPWRMKLRFSIANRSADALRQLSYDPELLRQPLHSFVLLAVGLRAHCLDDDKLRVLREAKRLYPDCALAHQSLAESLALESIPRRLEEAARHLTAAIAIDRENTNATFLLARILHEQGKISEAEERYQQVITRKPKAIGPRAYYVTMLQSEGREAEAQSEYQSLIAEHGGSDELNQTINRVYQHQRFRQQTLSVSEKPENATIEFLLQQQRKQGNKPGLPAPEDLKQKLDRLQRVLGR